MDLHLKVIKVRQKNYQDLKFRSCGQDQGRFIIRNFISVFFFLQNSVSVSA